MLFGYVDLTLSVQFCTGHINGDVQSIETNLDNCSDHAVMGLTWTLWLSSDAEPA